MDIMEKLVDFLWSISKAEEKGEHEFKCPLCGGKAQWGRAEGNGHLHAGCRDCNMTVCE